MENQNYEDGNKGKDEKKYSINNENSNHLIKNDAEKPMGIFWIF